MKAVMAKHLLASSVPNPSLILVAQCKKLITLNFKPDFDPLKDRFLPRTAILRDFFCSKLSIATVNPNRQSPRPLPVSLNSKLKPNYQ